MEVVSYFIGDVNDLLPLPPNAHLHTKNIYIHHMPGRAFNIIIHNSSIIIATVNREKFSFLG